ncbi:MAG: HAD family hydrolase [Erysipelotrichaceae bacterium]|nr:HAD family hydrolase [Erysipelotrichaceae bacterium]
MDEHRNLIFDLYGTLYDIHTNERRLSFWRQFAEYLKGYGMDYHPGQLQKKYLRSCRQETERMRKERGFELIEISIDTVFRQLCQDQGYEPDKHDIEMIARTFRSLSTDYLKLYPQVRETLSRLKGQGRRLFILSNAQQLFTDYEMEELNIREYFEGIFYSSACGCRKPSGRFYDCLFSRHGLKKQESVMIGNDYYSDILSAHDYGIASIYIQTNQSWKHHGPLPDDCRQIQKIGDILKLQQDWPTAERD